MALAAVASFQVALGRPADISLTARCGASFDLTCVGSEFGSCCSQYGYCGSTPAHCDYGCQPEFGTCGAAQEDEEIIDEGETSDNEELPVREGIEGLEVSEDGSCGGENGYTCLNSIFGSCCRFVATHPSTF